MSIFNRNRKPVNGNRYDNYLKFKHKRTKSGKNFICHAPFSSLRFTLSGTVQACCFNRLYVLGKYPEDNIQDLWSGTKAENLRKALASRNLSLGCSYCGESIGQGNFEATAAANYDYINPENAGMPSMFDFELGNNCNLECVMCNGENSNLIRKNREHEAPYSPPYDEAFVNQLEPFIPYLKEIRFVGGEPFLIEINYRIWEKVIEINPRCIITVLTNGTILNGSIRSLLTRGNFSISVSTDSVAEKTYEEIRKNGIFSDFIRNLGFFKDFAKERKRDFFLNFCPQRLNWKEIPDFFIYCNNNNINVILHTVRFPPGQALWNLSHDELSEILEFIEKKLPDIKVRGKTGKRNSEVYQSFINQLKAWVKNAKIIENTETENTESLKELFFQKLNNFLSDSPVFDQSRKELFYIKYKKRLEENFASIEKNRLNKLLLFLNSFNMEFIIAELEYSSDEKLRQKILSAAD